jgi:hypothetical protein
MTDDGVNRCKYHMNLNTELHNLIIHMIKTDCTSQWLMGDRLKRDQLVFLYKTLRIIFDSILKAKLMEADQDILEIVVPKLVAYKSLLHIKDILNVKYEEAKGEKEKAFRDTMKLKDENKKPKEAPVENEGELVKRRKEEEEMRAKMESSMSEGQKDKEAEQLEIDTYGVRKIPDCIENVDLGWLYE